MIAPATIFHGPQTEIVEKAILFLQSLLCPKKGCFSCYTCLQLRAKKEEHILWLSPAPKYTLDSFEILFQKVTLQVDTHKQFFFIIEKADTLPLVCANKLLKLVEEPPRGYHFLFLTELLNGVPKTIQSRCAIIAFHQGETEQRVEHPLVTLFIRDSFDPVMFAKVVAEHTPNEQETPLLLDLLIQKYSSALTQTIKEGKSADKKLFSYVQLYTAALQTLPAQGGAKLFWKHLSLQKHYLENNNDSTT